MTTDFTRLEERHDELRVQLAEGKISREEYDREVAKLQAKDSSGILWRISDLDGQWQRLDGSSWNIDVPLLFKKDYAETSVDRSYTWTDLACDPGDTMIEYLGKRDVVAVPFQEGEIPVFAPTLSTEDARRKAMEGITSLAYYEAKGSEEMNKVTFWKTLVTPRSFTRLAYPYWVVRYRYRDRGYLVMVDGVTGEIVTARAPGDRIYQGLAAAGPAAGGALAGLGFALAPSAGFDLNLVFLTLVPVAVGLIVTSWTYDYFRNGSEVVVSERSRIRRAEYTGRVRRIGKKVLSILKGQALDQIQGGLG